MSDTQEATIQELNERLARMEKFITRRFDEVSTEIHATCQMLDMAESGITAKFGEILGVLSAITFCGDGSSPHNVGVELDAVVKTTEDAANRILDAADDIAKIVKDDAQDWSNTAERGEKFAKIKALTDNILTACAFQDLTGQRIAKTLENIRRAEAELSETLKKMGLNVDFTTQAAQHALAQSGQNDNMANQDDIDSLFS